MLDDRTFGKEELGKYHPDYEDYSELETLVENGELEAFDYIISNAVLNVVPQDTRDNLTVAMGHLLKPGGQMFVNVISKGYNGAVNSNPERVQARSTNGELKYDKKGNPVYVGSVRTREGDYSEGGNTVGRGHETFVWGSNSVQKVFSTNELIGYLQDALGKGYTITKDSLGMTGVTVTKKGGNGAQYQARTNLSIEANKFSNTVDKWFNNGKKDGEVFSLGSTGSVIQGLGAIESDVYMLSDKINIIMEEHPEISIKEIKNIPEILENPVFILESKNAWGAKENTRITIFGMVKAQNNKPVMVVFDLNPEENNITLYDMQKVTSVYTKNKRENSTINLIRSSNIMYIDKQKATMLLHSVDFQHVYSVEQSGYVGRITYSGNIVNISGKKFNDVFSYNGINGKDSEGRELTAEQHDYFKDSKVRDDDGNLMVMYHGTKADFTVFMHDKIGSTGRFEGSGFNFTPSRSRAQSYGGRVMAGYVNITNPLSAEKKTIKLNQLVGIIREIDPTGDNLISDYANETRDYGKQSFINRESITTAKAIMDYTDTDVDIYSQLSASNPDAKTIIEKFKSLGYDGLIHYNDEGKIKTAVTFDSNQFKEIDNKTPTKNPDVQFQVRDTEYMELAQEPEKNRERLQEMVDQAAKDAGYEKPDFNVVSLNPSYIVPRNDIDRNRIGYISNRAAELSEAGEWDQRPILVYDAGNGDYKALTGSHRIEIAKTAEVNIDAVVIDESTMDELNDYLLDNYGLETYDFIMMDEEQQADVLGGAVRDGHVDLEEAYLLMSIETDSNYASREEKEQLNGIPFVARIGGTVFTKSSDPVTYDDEGNVIPLSERFNRKNNDIRYQIREIVGDSGNHYGKGVYLDSTLLSNLNDTERIQMVKEYVKDIAGSTFTAYDKNLRSINVRIAEKGSKFVNEKGKRVDVYHDLITKNRYNVTKQEAIVLVDELITSSKLGSIDPAKHKHGWLDNDGKNKWERWYTYLQDKNNTVWKATLHIANANNGAKYLYDIFPIKMVEQNGKSLTSTTEQSIPQPGVVSQQQNQTRTPIYTDREILQLANSSMGGTDITALEQEVANQTTKVNALKADPAKAAEYLTEKAKLDDLNKKYHRASTLDFFSAKMQDLEAAENALDEQQTKLDEAIASGEDDEIIKAHKNRLTVLKGKVTRAEAAVKNVENTPVMKDLLNEARVKAESGRPIKGTVAEARQGVEKRAKVLRDMLMKNSKDQHVPEALRKTVGDLLESINFDSKRSMLGGQQTKKDIKYTDAYNSRIPPPPFR